MTQANAHVDPARQRCFNHADTQAAARCPRCRRHYCRKCVTEHEGRVICAACLLAMAAPRTSRHDRLAALVWATAGAAGLVLIWAMFYWVGTLLMAMPSSFHEGTLWLK